MAAGALAWAGLVFPPLAPLADYGWFVGAFGAAAMYLALERLVPRPRVAAQPVR